MTGKDTPNNKQSKMAHNAAAAKQIDSMTDKQAAQSEMQGTGDLVQNLQ